MGLADDLARHNKGNERQLRERENHQSFHVGPEAKPSEHCPLCRIDRDVEAGKLVRG